MSAARACVLAAAVVALVTGCASGPQLVLSCGSVQDPKASGPAMVGLDYGAEMKPVPIDAVIFGDKALTKKVAVQSLNAGRTAGDTVQVTARFANCTAKPVTLGVRTQFMDKAQRPTEQPSAWRPVTVQPKSFAVYSESSVATAEVDHYLVELRDGDR